jgi:pyruvate dehydrogenase (quinone)
MKEWWELMERRESRESGALRPQLVASALNEFLAPNAIVSTDSGTITTWAARHIRIKRGQMFSCSGNLATMAPGLPYAIAAKVAFPDRQSVAFVGDGGFTMLMGEFATAVKHDLPILVIVIKNNVLGQIKWEQMVFLGNPEYGVQLHPIDFVKYAEACGGVGFRCSRPDEVRPAIEAAIKSGRPALVEAEVDPFEAPMPAKVKPMQAIHMAEALARGEPNGSRIALTLFRDKIDDYTGR